jgi:hypothetical protein
MSDMQHLLEADLPKCSQATCDKLATHAYVWDRQMYGCDEHTKAALNIAAAIGFPTVENTLKRLVPVRLVNLDLNDDDDDESTGG